MHGFPLAALLLAGSALSWQACAATDCAPKGVDVCELAGQFVDTINGLIRADRRDGPFKPSRASRDGAAITVHVTFLAGKEGLDALLSRTNRTMDMLDGRLLQVARESACADPLLRIVSHGGTYRVSYQFPDGTVFTEHLISDC